MQEENKKNITTKKQQGHDYFLYFSYIVMIAVIYFFYQNGAFEWLRDFEFFTTIKHYSFALFFAGAVILLLANIYAVIGLVLFYFLFKFALDLVEKTNF